MKIGRKKRKTTKREYRLWFDFFRPISLFSAIQLARDSIAKYARTVRSISCGSRGSRSIRPHRRDRRDLRANRNPRDDSHSDLRTVSAFEQKIAKNRKEPQVFSRVAGTMLDGHLTQSALSPSAPRRSGSMVPLAAP
jgi:hypothetical protein